MMSQKDLLDQKDLTVPLSKTMEDAIFNLREWARTRCRPATTDNRVLQIMQAEERRGETGVSDGADAKIQVRWKELAEYGQLDAAVIENVRFRDVTTFTRLVEDFAPYCDPKGEFGLVLRADTKVVIWTRMSQQLADIVSEFISAKRIYLHPADPSLYAGGWHPALPPIQSVGEDKLAKPHWLPTTLRLIPAADGSRKYGAWHASGSSPEPPSPAMASPRPRCRTPHDPT